MLYGLKLIYKILIFLIFFLSVAACAPDLRSSAFTPVPVLSVITTAEQAVVPTAIPEEPQVSPPEHPLAVVFVKNGEIQMWDEATQKIETIDRDGDAIGVWMSDDGQLIAFSRRSVVQVSELEWYELSSLWVMDRDGQNSREIISAGDLRQRLKAGEQESTDIVQVSWLPGTHRLLYSGIRYIAQGEGISHAHPEGVYLFDADTFQDKALVPAGKSLRIVRSPDSRQIAVITTTGLSFVDLNTAVRREADLSYPEAGLPMPILPRGVWTQDSQALLLVAPSEIVSEFIINFNIWRVPVDGSPAQFLATLTDTHSDSVTYSPDGSYASFYRSRGWQPELAGWFIVPLIPELGPLAIPRTIELGFANLHWSPGGVAFVIKGDGLFELCPNATQDADVCGDAVHLPERVASLRWLDSTRFMVATYEPVELYLGNLDGTMIPLVENYQSFDAVSPTCSNESELVSDVTIPIGTNFAPDSLIGKSWRIRNVGTCTWDPSYRLAFISGDRMMGPRSIPVGKTILPGEEVELSVNLIAPHEDGMFQGRWQLTTPDGNPFGFKTYVAITVP